MVVGGPDCLVRSEWFRRAEPYKVSVQLPESGEGSNPVLAVVALHPIPLSTIRSSYLPRIVQAFVAEIFLYRVYITVWGGIAWVAGAGPGGSSGSPACVVALSRCRALDIPLSP